MPLTESDPTVDSPQVSTPQYKPLLKHFAVRLCVAVTFSCSCCFGSKLIRIGAISLPPRDVMEMAVKLEHGPGSKTRPNTNTGRNSRRPTKSPITQWVLWRRQPYQGEFIAIDQDGVRRTMHTQCDDKTFTIWMFGDSVMWGAGAPDAETIPSLIAADYEKAGHPVCIVNYAEKGWSNTQELIGLMEESQTRWPQARRGAFLRWRH